MAVPVVQNASSSDPAAITIQFSGEGSRTWVTWVSEGKAYSRQTLDGKSWSAAVALTKADVPTYDEVHSRGQYAAFRIHDSTSWHVYRLTNSQYITSVNTSLRLWSLAVPVPEVKSVLTSYSNNWHVKEMVGAFSDQYFVDDITGDHIQGAWTGSGSSGNPGTPIFAWGTGMGGSFHMLANILREPTKTFTYHGSSSVMTGYDGHTAMYDDYIYWLTGTTINYKRLTNGGSSGSFALTDLEGDVGPIDGYQVSLLGVWTGPMINLVDQTAGGSGYQLRFGPVPSASNVTQSSLAQRPEYLGFPIHVGSESGYDASGGAASVSGSNIAAIANNALATPITASLPGGTIEQSLGSEIVIDGAMYLWHGARYGASPSFSTRSVFVDIYGNCAALDSNNALWGKFVGATDSWVKIASSVTGDRIIGIGSGPATDYGLTSDDADLVWAVYTRSGSTIYRHLYGEIGTDNPDRYEVIRVDMGGVNASPRFLDRTPVDQAIIDNLAPEGFDGLLSNRATGNGIVHLTDGFYYGSLASLAAMKKVSAAGVNGANVRLTMNDVGWGGIIEGKVMYQNAMLGQFAAGSSMAANGVPWMGGTPGVGIADSKTAYWFPAAAGTGRIKSIDYSRE